MVIDDTPIYLVGAFATDGLDVVSFANLTEVQEYFPMFKDPYAGAVNA